MEWLLGQIVDRIGRQVVKIKDRYSSVIFYQFICISTQKRRFHICKTHTLHWRFHCYRANSLLI